MPLGSLAFWGPKAGPIFFLNTASRLKGDVLFDHSLRAKKGGFVASLLLTAGCKESLYYSHLKSLKFKKKASLGAS